MNYQEISTVLALPEGTVKSRIASKEKIKVELSGNRGAKRQGLDMNNKSDSFEHYELTSAYLDGEVTKERAFIEESPDLLKEVDKLRK